MLTTTRWAREAAVLLALAGAACASGYPRGVACGGPMEDGRYLIADPPGRHAVGPVPFVATCRLDAAAARRLRAAASPVLWVEGLQAPARASVTVRVHLGTVGPVGSFTLLPDQGGGRPHRVQVPLGRDLAGALDPRGTLVVSLVAVDTQGRPEQSALTFDRLVLSAE